MKIYPQTTTRAILFGNFSSKIVKKQQFKHLLRLIYKEILRIFGSKRGLRDTTISKLKSILDDVLQYILRSMTDSVVALPKAVFMRAKAHGGSMRTILNYQTIRAAFENLGILESLDVKTHKGGPCQHYRVSLRGDMSIISEDDFVDRKSKKRSKRAFVKENDTYTVDLFGKDETVTGQQVINFVEFYEKKKQEYNKNKYIKVFKDGKLYKGSRLSHYVLGAVVCSRYQYDVRRFIEAQYSYFHGWKGEEPTIQYVTSIYSTWNCIGRYESYLKQFKNEIDHFGPGDDNIMPVVPYTIFKSVGTYDKVMVGDKVTIPKVRKEEAIQGAEVDFYNIKDAFKLSTKTIMVHYGHPLRRELSLHWLMTQPVWLQLLEEKYWGEDVDKEFWEYLANVDMDYVL